MFKKSVLVGIDIQPEEIRIVRLEKIRKRFHVMSAEAVSLKGIDWNKQSADAIPSIPQTAEFTPAKAGACAGQSLEHCVQSFKLTNTIAAISIPFNLVRMQKITLPQGLSTQEIEAEIVSHLERDLSAINEPLLIDFNILKEHENAYSEILFAAARQSSISRYMQCVAACGLKLKIIDLDIYALKRAIFYCQANVIRDEYSLILYVSEQNASLILCKQNYILDHQYWNLHRQDDLFIQLENRLQLITNNILDKKIKLFICGNHIELLSDINLPCIDEKISVNPFDHLSLSCELNNIFLRNKPSDFLIACGLAMREIPAW